MSFSSGLKASKTPSPIMLLQQLLRHRSGDCLSSVPSRVSSEALATAANWPPTLELAPTPWRSGTVDREQGISKAGNPQLRSS